MPILSDQDAARLTPLFQGKAGRALFHAVEGISGLKKINRLHDRVEACCAPGPDFAKGIFDEIGLDYLIGNAERLDRLPDGPFILISNHHICHAQSSFSRFSLTSSECFLMRVRG